MELLLPANVSKAFTYDGTLADWKKEEGKRRLQNAGLADKKRKKKKGGMVELLGKNCHV